VFPVLLFSRRQKKDPRTMTSSNTKNQNAGKQLFYWYSFVVIPVLGYYNCNNLLSTNLGT
jgi:hypothetical protein